MTLNIKCYLNFTNYMNNIIFTGGENNSLYFIDIRKMQLINSKEMSHKKYDECLMDSILVSSDKILIGCANGGLNLTETNLF